MKRYSFKSKLIVVAAIFGLTAIVAGMIRLALMLAENFLIK